ncbi:MAG TPA: hypothetical protein VGM07_06175 [Stellaceae bacterium]|jgi:hypothetical protein
MSANNAALTPEALLAGCERMHAAGGGRFELEIIRATHLPALLAMAGDGDTRALGTLFAVNGFIERCGSSGTLCLHCPRPLAGRLGAVALMRGMSGDAREALLLGFCRGCADGRTERALAALVIAALRQTSPFADLRELITAPVGHA